MHLLSSASGPGRPVWVVRHGESTWNAQGRMQRQISHPPLTAKGIAQAYAAAHILQDNMIARVVTSDAVRAHQTARIIAAVLGVDIVVDERLRERGWHAGMYAAATTASPERLEDPTPRIQAAMVDISELRGLSAVVTHGDIVCLLLDLLGARNSRNAHWQSGSAIPNGTVVPMRMHRLRRRR